MQKFPFNSVFLNYYRHEKIPHDLAGSFVSQTFTGSELIIEDDDSTSSLREITCGFTDTRIKAFTNDTNQQRQFGQFFHELTGKAIAIDYSDDAHVGGSREKTLFNYNYL